MYKTKKKGGTEDRNHSNKKLAKNRAEVNREDDIIVENAFKSTKGGEALTLKACHAKRSPGLR